MLINNTLTTQNCGVEAYHGGTDRKVFVPVDKDVPFSPATPTHQVCYPWLSMEVGDSFICTAPNATTYAGQANKRYKGKRFASRTVEGGIRIWRIA